jgi:hypothetical protein
MKDPNPSSSAAPASARPFRVPYVRAIFSHFWKAFAVLSLIAGVYVGVQFMPRWHHATEDGATESPTQDDVAPRSPKTRYRLISDLIDKQSQPATIVFKNQSASVMGYLASVDDECVVLRSFYKDEGKEQTVLIPWENVLYVRLNTKVAPIEHEVMAARDPRVSTSSRPRR